MNQSASAQKHPQKKSILLVEDELDVLEMLIEILSAEGYCTRSAPDGAEALAFFQTEAFDIVFTDMNMPGLSGYDVAAAVKKMQPAVPVVLLTGWDMDFDPVELKKKGIDALIKKPFAIIDILQTIELLCT